MCQLLAMNCNVATDICFSFTGFQARGGLTDKHEDGWGIAFFEGKGVRQFLDPLPSAKSPIAELVGKFPIHSQNVVAHLRKATQGRVALENTHPFSRELWGYYWIFAHNGTLKDYHPELDGEFHPVGDTDSERAFCWLLQELRREFGPKKPEDKDLFISLTKLSKDLGARGAFNFLLSNGEFMVAHSSTKLSYVTRKAPFPTPRLKDRDVTVDFQKLTSKYDRVAIIATVPLTENENWISMDRGTLWMFRDGEVLRQATTIAGPERHIEEEETGT